MLSSTIRLLVICDKKKSTGGRVVNHYQRLKDDFAKCKDLELLKLCYATKKKKKPSPPTGVVRFSYHLLTFSTSQGKRKDFLWSAIENTSVTPVFYIIIEDTSVGSLC